MGKHYEATGYGSTQFEAQQDAKRQINDQIQTDSDLRAATGLAGMLMGLAFMIIAGYAQLGWAIFKAAFYRPVPVLIFALIVCGSGVLIFAMTINGIHGAAEAFFTVFIMICMGSGAASALSKCVDPATAGLERLETRMFRAMPDVVRIPSTVIALLVPVFVYLVWIEFNFVSGSLTFGEGIMQSFTNGISGWLALIMTGAAAFFRASLHPLAEEFDWIGRRRPALDPVPAVQGLEVDGILDADPGDAIVFRSDDVGNDARPG